MAVRVPDTNTFSLQNVYNAVNDHANPTGDLADCFAKANSGYFDPDYDNIGYAPANSMKRFRNYGPPYCYVSRQSYQNASSSLDYNSRGLWIVPSGLIMFVLYRDYSLKRYNLSSAWNVSTASYYSGISLISPYYYSGLYWRYDGLVFYVVNSTLTRVERWNTSMPHDIGSASYHSSWDFSSYDTGMMAVHFNSTGTRMYLVGNQYTYTKLYQFNLSSSWTISSGVSYSATLDISLNHPLVGVFLSGDGKRLYTLGQNNNWIHQINLATAYELSTHYWNCLGQFNSYYDTHTTGIFLTEDISGNKPYIGHLNVYVTGTQNNKVYYWITDEQP